VRALHFQFTALIVDLAVSFDNSKMRKEYERKGETDKNAKVYTANGGDVAFICGQMC
jgi:hypothetical protein